MLALSPGSSFIHLDTGKRGCVSASVSILHPPAAGAMARGSWYRVQLAGMGIAKDWFAFLFRPSEIDGGRGTPHPRVFFKKRPQAAENKGSKREKERQE